MKIKNLTPFPAGPKVTSRAPPQPEMTFVVRGAFRIEPDKPLLPIDGMAIEQGSLVGDVFEEGDDEQRGECLYPSDFADFKPRAEVMLRGTCYTPFGKPLADCPVRFAVGAWSKILRVVGPRVWVDDTFGSASTKPLAFTKMPIGYTRSFGGPGHAPNPVGRGFQTKELPNVEDPREPIVRRADRPRPAGFGPLNPAWPERADKRGREYGRSYAKRAPYYAEDFEWSYFNSAPADQQLESGLVGDEELVFQNLHESESVLKSRLPGYRIRAFVIDVFDRFREVRMQLDTLFADLDAMKVHLVWRGLDKVREDDLTDVRTIVVGWERLTEKPFPVAHYRAILDEFERDPLEIKGMLADSEIALDPQEFMAVGLPKRGGSREPLPKLGGPPPPPDADANPLVQLMQGKMGALPGPFKDMLTKAGATMPSAASASPATGAPAVKGVDLQSTFAAVAKEPETPAAAPIIPLATPEAIGAAQRAALRQMLAPLTEIKKATAGIEAPAAKEKLAKVDDVMARIPKPTTDAPGPGADLSWQDFTGQSLRGCNLAGAKLEGTIFTRADLSGANFTGAHLKETILFDADLADADFTGAELVLANFASARAARARFENATLDGAYFDKAILTKAVFHKAKGKDPFFTTADLSDADFREVEFASANFNEATLERSDFTGSKLIAAVFTYCLAQGARFGKCVLTNSAFTDSDLRNASFHRADANGTVWMKASLARADFRWASLKKAHFSEADANGARFSSANLRDARFYRASLEQVEFGRANMMGADLSKTRLGGAKFVNANLYDAKLIGASGAGCDFGGANLKRALIEDRS